MKRIIIAILSLAALVSCIKDKGDAASDCIRSVTVSDHESNRLRVFVDVDFKQSCDYCIKYWKTGDPSTVFVTPTMHTDGGPERATLMFLYAATEYEFEIRSADGTWATKPLVFQTVSLPSGVTQYSIENGDATRIPGYIMQAALRSDGYMTIADTDGNVLWYEHCQPAGRDYISQYDVLNPLPDLDRIWYLSGYTNDNADGKTVLSSNIGCIDFEGKVYYTWSSEKGSSPVPLAHHEIFRMDDGNVMIVNQVEKTYDLSPIGGEQNTLVVGDGYTIITADGKILKQWDIFGELDLLTDTYLNVLKFNWDLVHANSLYIDSEGFYYMSFNRINQIWKIDPESGKVLYRVGENGNVAMDASGYPSGVHAVTALEPDRLLCLDNGIIPGVSRGLIYKVNPETMTAEVETCVTLPEESASYDRSNVALIDGGKTLLFGMTNSKKVIFTDLEGNIIKQLRTSVASYRTNYLEKLPVKIEHINNN